MMVRDCPFNPTRTKSLRRNRAQKHDDVLQPKSPSMKSESSQSLTLLRHVDAVIDMLREHHYVSARRDLPAEPLPSLLEQCESACAAIEGTPPLRTIHHFACSGGTLISKCLFALPNTVVMSEIDPLSPLVLKSGSAPFAPTDVILSLRQSLRPIDDATIIAAFRAALFAAKARMDARGLRLIVRDHAHSQFCTNQDYMSRPTLRDMLYGDCALNSVVTVRHPLDTFLSIIYNKWVHFTPGTLEEYSKRYLAFLDRYVGVPIVQYEDFVQDPESVLMDICKYLNLKYSPFSTELIDIVKISGDSGRRDTRRIGPRARRDIPHDIAPQRLQSESYRELCERLNYEI